MASHGLGTIWPLIQGVHPWPELLIGGSENPVAADLGPEPSSPLHGFLCPGSESQIHPVTGATFFLAKKEDPLEFKLNSDQLIQSRTAGDHIPAKNFRTAVPNSKARTEILIHFFLEEGDLAFVSGLVPEEPVSDDTLPGNALNLVSFDSHVIARRLFVMTEKVVPGRDEQTTNLKIDPDHVLEHSPGRFPRKGEVPKGWLKLFAGLSEGA